MAMIGQQMYHPIFNFDSQEYEDACPIPPRKSGFQYVCKCNHTTFHTMSEFKRHIKNKGHVRYISNYLENMKETEEFVSLIKQQRIEIGLLQQKVALLTKPLAKAETLSILFELD
jgi:hypothetical protein